MISFESRDFRYLLVIYCLGLFLHLFVTPVDAETIYVDGNNTSGIEDGTVEHPYDSINQAINVAANGDTVKVASALYIEDVLINSKAIKLEGEDPTSTTIQGTDNAINIDGSYSDDVVEIAGFTITQGVSNGVKLNSASVHVVIRNNIILGNGYGIANYLNGAKVTILNNTITQNTMSGIYVYLGNNNVVTGNIITLNTGRGILENSGQVLLSYNNAWANVDGDYYGNAITMIDNISTDPEFLPSSFYLSSGSPSIDRGSPLPAYKDPDGTRNDQGVYGGPGAANYWPSPAGGPVVTTMSVSPPSVPVGGTITLKATGKIR